MANTKTTGLAELAETPANDDIYPIVDVSDTTMALSGTNKYIKASRIVHQNESNQVTLLGNVGIGTASPTAKLDVAGTVQCDALRIDQTPTAGTFTETHYINVNLNGTTYRIPCAI